MRAYNENIQRSGRMGIGSCTITLLLPGSSSSCDFSCKSSNHPLDQFLPHFSFSSFNLVYKLTSSSFWQKTKWLLCTTTPLLTRPRSLWLCFVSTGEAGFERKVFRWCCWGSVRIASGPWQYLHWRFSAMFPAVGAALGSLHPATGGVLWRGLKFQICTDTLNKFFITIPEIFGSWLIS